MQEDRKSRTEATTGEAPLKSSSGTELAQFLKAVRDGRKDAVIASL